MISEKLSRFVTETDYPELPSQVKDLAKMCLLDWIGCTVAGSLNKDGRMFIELISEIGGTQESTILGCGERTSSLNAAFVNGALSHVLELDDIHKVAMYHPGVPVIPVALALAEREKLGGKELLAAIVMGYEIGIRIGVAVNPSHFRVWHTTGTVGTFGAAATAGSLLKLNKEQMISALGNAGTQAAGLWQFNIDGNMTKPLHPGKAAMNGLLAALLAKKGFTGPEHIIEGPKGFGVAASDSVDYDFITKDIGKDYEMLNIGFKIHVGCRHTSSPTDGALELVRKYKLRPENVAGITIRTYELAKDLTGNMNPENVSEARFSIAYCVATAIRYGQCSINEFSPDKLYDPVLRNLISKTRLVVDEEIETEYPQGYASIVEVENTEGKILSARTDHAKGDPENPVSISEMKDKFRLLTKNILSDSQIEKAIETVENIETVPDINPIMPLFFEKK